MIVLTQLDRDFLEFHHNNPKIFKLYLQFARKAIARGHTRYSVWGLMQIIRWHVDIVTEDITGYKLRNDYAALYARLIVLKHPYEFKDFFKFKAMKNSNLGPYWEQLIKAKYRRRAENERTGASKAAV
jgi:hypothetical protein